MALWYVRTGGSQLNAGSTNTDAASQSGAAGVVVTTTLTEVGAFAAAAATGVINLQDGGVSVIRTYTKVNDDSITLDSAPPGGDATYAWKIGGARALPNQVANSGAGNNVKIASGDTVYVQTGTYVGLLVLATAITIRGQSDAAWTVDGTGGGAGSDPVTVSESCQIYDCVSVNAVDDGFVRTTGASTVSRCRSQAPGGDGFAAFGASETFTFCSSRAAGAIGFSLTSSATVRMCEAGDCVGNGMSLVTAAAITGNLVYDNGGVGIAITTAAVRTIWGNTVEGNTGDGLDMSATTSLSAGSIVMNNIFSNNAIGVDSNAGAQAAADRILSDYNIFFGNSTARNNWITGTNDKTTDPAYTDAASDDYSPKSTGSAYKAGYSPFKNPTLNTVNIGAVAGPGSAEAEGTMPSASDVRAGVQYGAAGTEFTGTLVAGGAHRR